MAQTSFRAGSGDYQQVRPLTVNVSAIPGFATSVETFSTAAANITTGAIADIDNDSNVLAQMDTVPAGLVLTSSYIGAAGILTLVFQNLTGVTISPASQQVNLLVF